MAAFSFLGSMFLLFGLLLLVLSFVFKNKIQKQTANSDKISGKIISLRKVENSSYDIDSNSNRGTKMVTYYPTVEYEINGKTFSNELKFGSTKYKIGQSLEFLVDKNNPNEILFLGAEKVWKIFMAISILLLIISIAFYVIFAMNS